jgi:hypothetical protein
VTVTGIDMGRPMGTTRFDHLQDRWGATRSGTYLQYRKRSVLSGCRRRAARRQAICPAGTERVERRAGRALYRRRVLDTPVDEFLKHDAQTI